MKDVRVKVEVILSDNGYTIVTESDTELNPLEMMGLTELVKTDLLTQFHFNPDLKLSEQIEQKFTESVERLENKESVISDLIKGMNIPGNVEVVDMRGKDLADLIKDRDCDCVSCRVMKGELQLTNLTKEEEAELTEIAERKNIPVEALKKQLTDLYLKSQLQKEEGKVSKKKGREKLPIITSNIVGEA